MSYLDNFSTSMSDRFDNLCQFPRTFAHEGSKSCLGISIGIVATALSVFNGGTNPSINKAANLTYVSAHLLTDTIFTPSMRVINPKFGFNIGESIEHGVFSKYISQPILKKAKQFAKRENFFLKHVASRVTFLAGTLIAIATRIADLTIGLFAGLASVVTLGIFPKVNTFAIRHLQSTNIIHYFCYGIRGIVNPQQFVEKSR